MNKYAMYSLACLIIGFIGFYFSIRFQWFMSIPVAFNLLVFAISFPVASILFSSFVKNKWMMMGLISLNLLYWSFLIGNTFL